MEPGNRSLTIYQGAVWAPTFRYKSGETLETATPVDITGWSARMQVRARQSAEDVLLELTSDNGKITLGGALGTIKPKLTAEETAALEFHRAVYNIELVPLTGEDDTERFLEGAVGVSPEITRTP